MLYEDDETYMSYEEDWDNNNHPERSSSFLDGKGVKDVPSNLLVVDDHTSIILVEKDDDFSSRGIRSIIILESEKRYYVT
jgi:hypothetical protein